MSDIVSWLQSVEHVDVPLLLLALYYVEKRRVKMGSEQWATLKDMHADDIAFKSQMIPPPKCPECHVTLGVSARKEP